ncbi:MAG: ABC transporter ATP-binding protein/permease [Exilispira sp.]|jgi:ATP-binding cassette subfamily B protein|nr:ABC transporter ATP-binding protein/permease [Exilispira sp.]
MEITKMEINKKESQKFTLFQRLRYIFTVWSEHKTRIFLLVVLSLINTAASTVYPLLLRYIIDNLGKAGSVNSIYNAIALIIASSIVAATFYSMLQMNRVYTNMSFTWKITLSLLNWVLRQKRQFFHSFSHGELLTRLTDDVEKISWQLCSGIFRFFDALSIISFSLFFMFGFSWKLTLFVILPIAVIMVIMVLFDETWEKLFETLQEKISTVNNTIEKTFASIKVIKSNKMESFAKKEFNQIMKTRRTSEMKLSFFHGLWHSLDLIINYSALLLIIIFGGKQVIVSKLTLGTFIAFLQYFYLMFDYLYSFAYFFVEMKRTLVSIGRHCELFFFKNEKLDTNENFSEIQKADKFDLKPFFDNSLKYDELTEDGKTFIEEIHSVRFEDISLQIKDRKILDSVSFSLKKGQIIGITGEIGSGKSICMHILAGLENPTSGKIFINDIPFENIDMNSYQNQVGFVFQEPQLFSVSVKENIVLPQENESEMLYSKYLKRKFLGTYIPLKPVSEKMEFVFDYDKDLFDHAISIASLNDDIKSFAKGIDTQVGPRGYTLSGGQRERITIARAVYKNPSLFIFDDSTRSLDYETEQKVLAAIRKNNKNAIIIIITQRIRSIVFTDEIFLFKNGKIIAKGKHNQLLEKSEDYKELYEKEMVNQ